MAKERFEVIDGPLKGDVLAIEDLRYGGQITVPTANGRRAVYEYTQHDVEDYDYDGYRSDRPITGLWFVGYEI